MESVGIDCRFPVCSRLALDTRVEIASFCPSPFVYFLVYYLIIWKLVVVHLRPTSQAFSTVL